MHIIVQDWVATVLRLSLELMFTHFLCNLAEVVRSAMYWSIQVLPFTGFGQYKLYWSVLEVVRVVGQYWSVLEVVSTGVAQD